MRSIKESNSEMEMERSSLLIAPVELFKIRAVLLKVSFIKVKSRSRTDIKMAETEQSVR